MEAGKGVQAMSFGERLRRRREEKGMTQQQLAPCYNKKGCATLTHPFLFAFYLPASIAF